MVGQGFYKPLEIKLIGLICENCWRKQNVTKYSILQMESDMIYWFSLTTWDIFKTTHFKICVKNLEIPM